MADKITLEQKPDLMARIGGDYAVVKAAQAEVHKLELVLAPSIRDIVASFGAGPHKMPLPVEIPDPDNPGKTKVETKVFFASFRKSGDIWLISAVDQNSIT